MSHKHERRSGKDRREEELDSLGKIEQRTHVEARRPEIIEVKLSESEWEKHFCNRTIRVHELDIAISEEASDVFGRACKRG